MAVAMFDTLKFANALKAAGVPEKQAEAEATILAEALQMNLKELTTKEDLKAVEDRINARFDKINWMLGFALTFLVAIVIRLFILRNPI